MSAVSFSPILPRNAAGESTHRFGPGLIGVISHPQAQARDAGLVLFNAGLVQHAGPFRGYTQLARVLAGLGFPVLRFDHGGLGDSEACTVSTADRRVAELRAALDLLSQQTGIERFVLGGICAGADEAFHCSGDPRVVGLLMLDGLSFRTPGFWWRHLLPRVFSPARLGRLISRASAKEAGMGDYRDFPTQANARRTMSSLAERKVALQFLFTGGAYEYFNHPGQLAASLGKAATGKNVSLAFWPDCDHTFYLQRDRERLHRLVAEWMQAQFDSPGSQ